MNKFDKEFLHWSIVIAIGYGLFYVFSDIKLWHIPEILASTLKLGK